MYGLTAAAAQKCVCNTLCMSVFFCLQFPFSLSILLQISHFCHTLVCSHSVTSRLYFWISSCSQLKQIIACCVIVCLFVFHENTSYKCCWFVRCFLLLLLLLKTLKTPWTSYSSCSFSNSLTNARAYVRYSTQL